MNRAPLRIATITLSDTRTQADDESGRVLGELLQAAGFAIASHTILREDPDLLRETISLSCGDRGIDAIVTTGGTGLAPRDRTIETLQGMFEKTLDGFGEAFRRMSWDAIGPNAILSRAAAGVVRRKLVVALPGSTNAVRLAVTELLAPTLAHAVALASGAGGAAASHGSGHKKGAT